MVAPASTVAAIRLDQPAIVPQPVLAAALDYAGLGLRVIPLVPGKKVPDRKQWQRHASSDPRVVRPYFERFPERNIGIATGRGIFVLDVDPRNGGTESFGSLVTGRTLPITARARTGGGGDHYLFRYGQDARIKNGSIADGLDIKGDGGYIVVEPSVHPSGRKYVWLSPPRQGIADVPNWLWTILLSKGLVENRREPAAAEIIERRARGGVVRDTDRRPQDDYPLFACGSRQGDPDLHREPAAAEIIERRARGGVVRDTDRPPQDDYPLIARGSRQGDRDVLLQEMKVKFPVDRVGTRNDQMKRVVASLAGRRYEPGLILDVVSAWWRHYHELGSIRTSPEEATTMIVATLRSLAKNPSFSHSTSGIEHRSECQAIHLEEWQTIRMHGSIPSCPPPQRTDRTEKTPAPRS
jgi:hypothetical protein